MGSKWVFCVKCHVDDIVERYKGYLVVKGFHQRLSVDFFKTFSLVVKPIIVCLVLCITLMNNWPIRQLDFNNAFLNGELLEDVYMSQLVGFVDTDKPTYVCKLQKAIYGLK